jgi:hypothetical protein
MLTVYGSPFCETSGLTRRKLLQVGGAGMLGLTLPKILAAEEAAPPVKPRAKNVIFLLLFGGPSQLETFDQKPEAPSAIRGPFATIDSRTPGLHISECLPRLAAASDKYCVVRTLGHNQNDHSAGIHYLQTGRPWHVPIGAGFNATSKDWPSLGSIVDYSDQRTGQAPSDVPSYVFLPKPLGHMQKFGSRLERPGQYGGWLGKGFDPLCSNIEKRDELDNPYFRFCHDDELDFTVGGLHANDELTLDRLDGRRTLLEQFDDARRTLDASASTVSYDRFRRRALSLVASSKTRDALDIRRESTATRDRYGRSLFGQSVLAARRLVEAGTRFVSVAWDTVNGYSWDSHIDAVDQKNHLLPGLDNALASLLEDLEERGLLDETLVVCCGEMGRTPKANGAWGRGHWSYLFPAVLAGAGVRGGTTYGRSDRSASAAAENPSKPEDLAATILTSLGIDPEQRIHDAQGRPVALVDGGRSLPVFG